MAYSFGWNAGAEATRGRAIQQSCERMHAQLRADGRILRLSDPFAYHNGIRWKIDENVHALTDYVDDAIGFITGRVPTTEVKYSIDVPQEKKGEAVIHHFTWNAKVDIYITPPCVHTLDEFLGIYAHKVAALLLKRHEAEVYEGTDRYDLAYAAFYTFAWECVHCIDPYVASGSHHDLMIQWKRTAGV